MNRTQVSIDPNTDFLIQNLNQNNYQTLQDNKSDNARPKRGGATGLSVLDIRPHRLGDSFEKTLMDHEIDDSEKYKLLLKCMKAWKLFHRYQKQKRADKNKSL